MQRFEVQFPAIFIIFGSESKSRSKLATNQVASALGISTTFYWSKVLWERNFFPVSTPFLLVVDTRVGAEPHRRGRLLLS